MVRHRFHKPAAYLCTSQQEQWVLRGGANREVGGSNLTVSTDDPSWGERR